MARGTLKIVLSPFDVKKSEEQTRRYNRVYEYNDVNPVQYITGVAQPSYISPSGWPLMGGFNFGRQNRSHWLVSG